MNKSTTLSTLFHLRDRYPVRVMFVGWPGIHVSDYSEQQEMRRLLLDRDCIPVFPSVDEFGLYMEFCNTFLWPAFNNVVRSFQGDNPVPFDKEKWAAYQVVNQRYADVVVSNVREACDIVWVHDYHLLLVPMTITRKLRKANIGFFLHSPFPSSEIFRCLPVREELLKGMLCADLIGFHFWEYTRHFLTCCRRILGLEFEFKRGGFIGVDYCSREVSVRVGHTCLQFDFTMEKIRQPEVVKQTEAMAEKYGERFVMVGIDRLDRLSGLKLKLLAYRAFLRSNLQLVHRVVLVQYVYLSSLQSAEDREIISSELMSLVEKIRDDFGPETVEIFIGEFDHETKYAALRTADCLIDTCLKDGLNLIPFEFCAARLSLDQPSGGVMIISEFTGCSRVLVGALKVNPWNTDRVAEAMLHAIQMSGSEKRRHFAPDANYVSSHSLLKWATDFLSDVREARKKDEMVYVSFGFGANTRLLGIDQHFGKLNSSDVVQAFQRSSSGLRLFLLDNEGTLAPDLRELAREHQASGGFPDSHSDSTARLSDQGAPPSKAVLSFLKILCKDKRNVVVITSGRPRRMLESWFSSVPGIGYAAEHGFTYKVDAITENKWITMLPPGCESTVDITSWTSVAFQLMDIYRKRVQNTYIHFKGSAMVWQYREADPELGAWQARELSAALEETLSPYHVVVSSGKGYVEVRIRGVNKGVCASLILSELEQQISRPDFVLCIGDDRSDELMFEAVNEAMKPELQAAEELGPPPPEICRARSGKSFSDLTVCTPGVDVRRVSSNVGGSSMKRSPSLGGAAFGDNTLGAMESKGSGGGGSSRMHIPPVFTCTVGKKPSKAKYYLNDVDEVSDLLQRITSASLKESSTPKSGGTHNFT